MFLLGIVLFLVSSGCTGGQSGVQLTAKAVPVVSQHQTDRSNETLVAFVENAAAYVKTNGAQKALAEFSNPNGSFIRGELYIYAYGFNGTTLAHPVNPESIGKIREGAIGVFVTEMGEVVRNGSGFYRFTYVNPQHNGILESKLGYGVKIDDDWWIGSGVYTGPVETAAAPLPATPGT
ncbi:MULTISPECIES: cache domain-containing protein [unclassified Methanoregula]|uniref:cache domain-containing protein n=1 Tax=unclassified Methanoregula TaxID=2649730 RepID=UPI0009D3A21C|nr:MULTISPECIES: cache domain-containing protein [unclassified Methanoregula]OPX65254.1 MAG: hypothetical protein A4E33_00287 [Methanoregula sp. PtaB.Bin085]OPY32163.1 MAG: hypothetical protein A4E34_02537 [Methanoregula sp. PtaU1.Bin006]